MDRVGCSGSSRWLRWRRRRAHRLRPRFRGVGAGLFDAGFLEGKPHALCLGPTEEIPFLKQQERLTFARCGITDPLSLSDYISHGGYRGLERALKLDAGSDRRRSDEFRTCAGAAAPDFPPESNGARF